MSARVRSRSSRSLLRCRQCLSGRGRSLRLATVLTAQSEHGATKRSQHRGEGAHACCALLALLLALALATSARPPASATAAMVNPAIATSAGCRAQHEFFELLLLAPQISRATAAWVATTGTGRPSHGLRHESPRRRQCAHVRRHS